MGVPSAQAEACLGVYARGTMGGPPACRNRDGGEAQHGAGVRRAIERVDLVQEAGCGAAGRDASEEAEGEAGGRQGEPAAEHESAHGGRRRTERQAHGDLARALSDDERPTSVWPMV